MNPEITLLHVHEKSMGYARAGTCLHEGLVRAGVDVYDIQDSPEEPVALSPGHVLDRAGESRPSGDRMKHTNAVCWVATPGHPRGWWDGQYAAMFTMWEATRLPESFRDRLHEFDLVCVPSEQNVEMFSTYNDNVRLVPLGIDPVDWHYLPRQAPETEFRFLIGGSGERKGDDIAFSAFKTVFGDRYDGPRWTGDGPAPILVMKSPRPREGFYAPWVRTIAGKISAEEEQDLYATSHVYLQPSRGEGFGLQPLQAIAQGLPTILTDAHGHAGYAQLGIPISAKLVPAGYFAFGNAPGMEWWEPDFEEICEAMWDTYQDYESHTQRALESAKVVATEWTWDRSAEAFIDAFGGELTKPAAPSDVWHAPVPMQFFIRVNRHWEGQIGEKFRIFEPGKDYYDSADVKRIFFESGLLDPVCLENVTTDGFILDLGLTEEQLEQVPHYRAENAFCRTCGQQVNTRPTKADAIYEEMVANAGALG